jgi:SpoVK/Ycf46/Vps4 family AAA+-type ATPase
LCVTAEEFGAALHTITPGSVFGAYLGESERRLRDTFESAAAEAASGQLVIIFLDEVDSLCPRRGSGSNQHQARVVAQLLTLLDGAAAVDGGAADAAGRGQQGRLVVVAATNRPNALDPALRRPGRLDREVAISVPDAAQRADILRCVWCRFLSPGSIKWLPLAAATHVVDGRRRWRRRSRLESGAIAPADADRLEEDDCTT